MSQSCPVIVNIASVPKSTLASLHLRYLPSAFTGFTGLKLLELYYDALSEAEDAFGLVAVVEGCTAGFACAIRSKKSIQHLLFMRFPLQVCHWSLMQVLHKPQILVDLMRRRRLAPSASDGKQWQRPADWDEWYTYRPLVVDAGYRKYRLADSLTHHLIAEAKQRGVPGLISIVERSNSPARVTHMRHGFREVWRGEDRIVFARELTNNAHAEPNPSR